ncbi:MAG: hypothetical protein KC643_21280 [Nitrospira sp.]|nr:hypothetical protein [Nitrospira sp.]MDR4488607.1 hypothetical protein [Nitrospirales bacterium]
MLLPSLIAIVFGLALILGDWFQFTTLKPWACRYGCPLARRRDSLPKPKDSFPRLFKTHSTLPLPHGIARWVGEQQAIVIRPYYQLFSMRFRTAWPLKGTIDYHFTDTQLHLGLSKRIPWSSAILTAIWLLFVIGGTLAFLVMFAVDGGFSSMSGLFFGIGLVALGILVLAGGLILLSLAYRLEDSRLMQVYQELLVKLGAQAEEAEPPALSPSLLPPLSQDKSKA